jgi:hypothetical protein
MKWYKQSNIDDLFDFKDKPMRERFRSMPKSEPKSESRGGDLWGVVYNECAEIIGARWQSIGGEIRSFSESDAQRLTTRLMDKLESGVHPENLRDFTEEYTSMFEEGFGDGYEIVHELIYAVVSSIVRKINDEGLMMDSDAVTRRFNYVRERFSYLVNYSKPSDRGDNFWEPITPTERANVVQMVLGWLRQGIDGEELYEKHYDVMEFLGVESNSASNPMVQPLLDVRRFIIAAMRDVSGYQGQA